MNISSLHIIGIALLMTSCGESGENKVSLNQTRAAIDVRDAWRDELKPIEVKGEGKIDGADKIGVRLTSDGETKYLAFKKSSESFKPEAPLTVDTASTVSACWPVFNSDTVALSAPFTNLIYGKEQSRAIGTSISITTNFRSSMALLRLCFESTDIKDVLESISLKGEELRTAGKYLPYAGNWIETTGEGMSMGISPECLLNAGRSHDFYLVPVDNASDIVLTAMVSGKENVYKTKIPPLAAGSMTQINLKLERESLTPRSSWVDNEWKPDFKNVEPVDTIRIGHYLRKDGYVVAKRDTMTVAVVFETDGRHGKAVGLEDIPGSFNYGSKSITTGKVFKTIDGKRNEGIINGSAATDDQKLIFKPEMPYPDNCAFGYSDGAGLSKSLMSSKTPIAEALEKNRCAYLPSLAEMASLYYKLQPYAHSDLANLIEPFTGEYITSSESSDATLYGINMTNGVIMSNYSKQFATLKLRLIYLF